MLTIGSMAKSLPLGDTPQTASTFTRTVFLGRERGARVKALFAVALYWAITDKRGRRELSALNFLRPLLKGQGGREV